MRKRKKAQDRSIFTSGQTFSLLPSQLTLARRTEERVVALIGGVGSGKTVGGGAKAFALAAQDRVEGMIVAPTYKMLMRVTLPAFMRFAKPYVVDHNRTLQRIELCNGSVVWYASGDNADTLRGPNLSWWWLDEGAVVSRMAYDELLARLRVRSTHLQGVITTTPTAGGWLREEFDTGRESRWFCRAPTWENHYNDPQFLQNLYASYDAELVALYVKGEWAELSGLVYPEFSRAESVVDWEPRVDLPILCGVDFGFQFPAVVYAQQVPRSLTIGDRILPAGSVVVFDEDMITAVSTEGLGRRIAQRFPANGPFSFSLIACDPAGSSMSVTASEHGGISDVTALKEALRSEGHHQAADAVRYVCGPNTKSLRSVHTGLEAVRGRLKNSQGIRTLYYDRKLLSGDARGVARGKEKYKWRKNEQKPVKGGEEQLDHAQDAERYMIRHLNITGPGIIRAA